MLVTTNIFLDKLVVVVKWKIIQHTIIAGSKTIFKFVMLNKQVTIEERVIIMKFPKRTIKVVSLTENLSLFFIGK